MKLARILLTLMTMTAAAHASVTKTDFGKTAAGTPIELYTLKNAQIEAHIITYGARVQALKTADKAGKVEDVVLGYDTVAGYEHDGFFFGAIVGRYGNRIAKGQFTIDGASHQVPLNDGPNALHGGPHGFDKLVWRAAVKGDNAVEMTLVSPDGDMGFPGALTSHVTYRIEGSSLHIDYAATTTKSTVLNLTNHSYFNLSGAASGTILSDEVTLFASHYTPVNSTLIPTGELAPVAGTPFDFTKPHVIGERIESVNDQLKIAGGYDHNWVLDGKGPGLHKAAEVVDTKSGRVLTVLTTEPGVQFYTGNFITGKVAGKGGVVSPRRGALCLETQHFPDSPNQPKFPTTELKPGQTMHSTTVFEFSVKK